jgi:hypothetical protein
MMSVWRHHRWGFVLRFAVLFALVHAPLPWLADGYTTAFGTVANGVLFLADHGSRIGFRFEPPNGIARKGSWFGVLRVEDRAARQTARMKLDVRTFSYRPIGTFLALAGAARLPGLRRNIRVVGGGLALTVIITSALAVVAALRFGIGRVLGFGSGPIAETIYEALTTPAMAYTIPLLCFCSSLQFSPRLGDKQCDDSETTARIVGDSIR